jgi:hypothetical protein
LRELEECPGWVLENIYKIEKITDLKKETNKKKKKTIKTVIMYNKYTKKVKESLALKQ